MTQSHDLPEQQPSAPDTELVTDPDQELELDPADPEAVAHATDRDAEELAHVDDPDPEAVADELAAAERIDEGVERGQGGPSSNGVHGGS